MIDKAQTQASRRDVPAHDFRTRFLAFCTDKMMLLEIIERGFLAALFAHFAYLMLQSYQEWHDVGMILLIISESIAVALIMSRRLSNTLSTQPFDWVFAFAGTAAPLLAMPAAASTFVPANISVGFILAGLCVQISAKVILWRSFGLVPANRGIKISGLYRIVRHPMYAGYFLTHIGFMLGFPSARNVLLYFMALAIQIVRISREERILRQDPAYRDYAARVRYRLLPGIF